MDEAARAGSPPLAALFDRGMAAGEASALALPGGAPLFLAGEPADRLFLLRSGRLAARRGGDGALLGEIGPGEPAGEMAALEGGVHGASVIAVRDCELWSLPRLAFAQAAASDPALMAEIAALIVGRVRGAALSRPPAQARTIGFFALASAAPVLPMVERIAAAARALGRPTRVVAGPAAEAAAQQDSFPAKDGELAFYVAEAGEAAWIRRAHRQVDAAFAVIEGGAAAPPGVGGEPPSGAWRGLIVIWRGSAPRQPGAGAWADRLGARPVYHVGESDAGDAARLARTVTGRAVGLVLSGGSARGLAHVGVLRALRRRGVPIDEVAGASMGAVIALAVAMDWPQGELEERIRDAFSRSSPIADIAFPFLSLSRGGIVRQRLREHFGDTDIADLARPFFCLASNLTTGEPAVRASGLARRAVLASLSIPGVLPPVIEGGDILVDGAVMNNFPADFMRASHPGPIIGVDVGKAQGVDAADLMTPSQIIRWLVSGAWRRGPPIVSLLMRAATVSAGREVIAARAMTDLLIEPAVEDIEIRDWRAFDRAARAGEIAAEAALDAGLAKLERVHGPLTPGAGRP